MAKKVSSKTKRTGKSASRKTATVKKAVKKASKKTVKKAATKKTVKKTAKKTVKKVTSTASANAPKKKVRHLKSPLTKKQLKEFREMLLEKRRSIVGDMNGIEAEALRTRQDSTGDLSNMPTHPADIGTDNYEHEFTLGLLESDRILMSEINEALERIDNGTYGVCLGTGEPIGVARLRARPWAKYCIEYARLIEKGLVRPSNDDYGDEDPAIEPDADMDDEDEVLDDGEDQE